VFYKLNGSRITLREFWWETKLFAWVGLIVKLFKIRLRGSTDDLAVDSLRPFLAEERNIRPEVLERFAPTIQQLRALGFEAPVWHDEEDVVQATRNTLATLRHESGRAWARVQCRTNFGRVPAKVKFFTTFISRTPGGFIATGNGKYDMAWPKTHDTVRFRLLPAEQVWAMHQQRMTAAVQPVTREQLLDAAEAYHASLRDFHLARGVFQPLGDEELALYPAAAPADLNQSNVAPPTAVALDPATDPTAQPPLAAAAPPDLMEVATLDELRRLQNKKVNWRFSIALLAISAMLFIANSRHSEGKQDWEYVAIIVGILLVHEFGHYIAMKIFGYRNLRMFFIPGFGAAVSGRHFNAPAWKKIIVSLMGPLPGIVAGTVLLVVALVLHNELFFRIGLFALIINTFNLIPILPFDGGWVAHAALFSRHPKLDVGFRLVAALLLIGIGLIVPGTRFLTFVAIASLLALPMAYKLATIVSELRQIPAIGVSPDSQTIPTATARIILAKVRERFNRNLTASLAAQHVARVFESLNARPASVGATIGLLSLHASAFVVALVVGVVAIAVHQQQSSRHNPVDPARYVVTDREIESAGPEPTSPRNVLVARFKSIGLARAHFSGLSPARPASRFGQTLLVAFTPTESAFQRDLFNQYEKVAEDTFVETQKMRAEVVVTCNLPSTGTGKQALEDLELYFQGSDWRLIPPWASETDWPSEQRALQTVFRRLVKELQAGGLSTSTELKQLWAQLTAARRRGDTDETTRLQVQIKKASEDAQAANQRRLKEQYGHADFIDKWAEIQKSENIAKRQARLKQEIAPLLGRVPPEESDDQLANSGFATRVANGRCQIYCNFTHTDTGLTAMTRWLFSQGASDIRYVIQGAATAADDDATAIER
jgi:Zn-dependent protease